MQLYKEEGESKTKTKKQDSSQKPSKRKASQKIQNWGLGKSNQECDNRADFQKWKGR